MLLWVLKMVVCAWIWVDLENTTVQQQTLQLDTTRRGLGIR